MTKALFVIGASKDSIREARETIKMILTVPNIDNPTRVVAIKALSTLCSVNNTTVSGCTFKGEGT
jgi:hypothetical protein